MSRDSSRAGVFSDRRSVDLLLAVLADEQRRTILRYVQRADGSDVSLEALAAALAESDATDCRDPDRVAVELHHSHLPKLAETSFIEYDVTDTTVRCHDHERLDSLLATLDDLESPAAPVRDQENPS